MEKFAISKKDVQRWASFHYYSKPYVGEPLVRVYDSESGECIHRYQTERIARRWYSHHRLESLEGEFFSLHTKDRNSTLFFALTQDEIDAELETCFRLNFVHSDPKVALELYRNRHPFTTYFILRAERVFEYGEGCNAVMDAIHDFCGKEDGAYIHTVARWKYNLSNLRENIGFSIEILINRYAQLGQKRWEMAVGDTRDNIIRRFFPNYDSRYS